MSTWEPLSNREVDPLDALLLRGDDDPAARSTMLGLYVLEDAPSWPRVVAAFDRASRTVRRLRQRVMASTVPFRLPYWIFDPDFQLGYHVRRMQVSGPGTLRTCSTSRRSTARSHWAAPGRSGRRPWSRVSIPRRARVERP